MTVFRVLTCAKSQGDNNVSEECASSVPDCQNYVQVEKEVKFMIRKHIPLNVGVNCDLTVRYRHSRESTENNIKYIHKETVHTHARTHTHTHRERERETETDRQTDRQNSKTTSGIT